MPLTLLLLKGCPKQVDGWFLGQVDGTRLLVDMSYTVSAVALYIFCILQSEKEKAELEGMQERTEKKNRGEKEKGKGDNTF